jgi:puromycin-sensitive aminopeptidase
MSATEETPEERKRRIIARVAGVSLEEDTQATATRTAPEIMRSTLPVDTAPDILPYRSGLLSRNSGGLRGSFCQKKARGIFAIVALFLILVFWMVTAARGSAPLPGCSDPTTAAPSELYMLSGDYFRPEAYSVFWGFSRGLKGNVTSAVDILFRVQSRVPCEWVWLNADRARVLDIEATAAAGSSSAVAVPVTAHPTLDVIGLRLPREIAVSLAAEHQTQSLSVHMTFRLNAGPDLDGLYISTWDDKTNGTHTMVASQLEATAGRRAFPSVDQPNDKATFDISVGCIDCAHLTILSNMPQMNEMNSTEAGFGQPPAWATAAGTTAGAYAAHTGARTVTFEKTPRMSTYLVALVMGELEFTETTITYDGNSTRVRCYTTAGSRKRGVYALEAAAAALTLYSQNFEIGFPLPKADMVAVPDFAAGAMENWGLVLYRETALLVDLELSSESDKQWVVVVVAHELAHQWFGNLVTMTWWNDLWLNEGFATFTEYSGTDAVEPTFEIWRQFLRNVVQPALALDGTLTATHRLHQPEADVLEPGAIEEQFDTIDYEKGAAVVRMLATAVDRLHGVGSWQKGVARYLRQHEYANARSNDLWQAIAEETCDATLPEQFLTWSVQEGFPLISTTVDPSTRAISFSQHRFLNLANPPGRLEESWWVPLTFCVFGGAAAHAAGGCDAGAALNAELLPGSTAAVGLNATATLPAGACLKVNVGVVGFYRVDYDLERWQCLLTNFPHLGDDDRAGLVDDVFYIARSAAVAGVSTSPLASYEVPLSFARLLANETALSTWSSALSHLGWIDGVLGGQDSACQSRMAAFILQVIDKQVLALGLTLQEGDTHLKTLLRTKLATAAVVYGHNATVEAARLLYANESASPLSPDSASMVYKAIVRWGSTADFDAMQARYLQATFASERERCMYALAATRDPALIARVLHMSIGPDVRSQDTVHLVAAVASYPAGRDLAWAFVREHWTLFVDRYGAGGFAFTRLVRIASGFFTDDALDEINAFFDAHPVPAAEHALSRVKEEVAGASAWVSERAGVVCGWLQVQQSD